MAVNTILRPGTHTFLAVLIETFLLSRSSSVGSGIYLFEVSADLPSSVSHGKFITVCSAPILLQTSNAAFIYISKHFWP